MKYSDLTNFYSNITEIKAPTNEDDILGISDLRNLQANNILFIKNKKFLEKFLDTQKEKLYIIIQKDLIDDEVVNSLSKQEAILSIDNVDLGISFLTKPFYDEQSSNWNEEVDGRQLGTTEIDPSAYIAQNVFIGKNVSIGKETKVYPGTVIMSDVIIGDYCEIFPNVVIYQNTKIQNKVRIHAGSILGCDGYGYNFKDGVHEKVWHLGGVVIEDNVEIGANTCIDKGVFSNTFVGAGSKIDNQVHLAHNVQVGKGVILCGQTALAGSARIGNYSVMGGRACLGPDVEIVAETQVAGNGMVQTSWDKKVTLGGHPARPINEWLRGVAFVRKESLKKKK